MIRTSIDNRNIIECCAIVDKMNGQRYNEHIGNQQPKKHMIERTNA